MRSTRRVSLFEREIRVRLGQAAIELFFASASVLSEGRVADGAYFGSTMLTIDLARLSNHLSEACDLATARNTEILLVRDPRVHDRARAVAVAEASRLAGCEVMAPWVDIKVRRAARHFYIDIDVEARLVLAATTSGSNIAAKSDSKTPAKSDSTGKRSHRNNS